MTPWLRSIAGALAVAAIGGVFKLLIWGGAMDARVAALEQAAHYYHGKHWSTHAAEDTP